MREDDPQAIKRQSRSIFGIALAAFVVVVGGFVLFVFAAIWFLSSISGG